MKFNPRISFALLAAGLAGSALAACGNGYHANPYLVTPGVGVKPVVRPAVYQDGTAQSKIEVKTAEGVSRSWQETMDPAQTASRPSYSPVEPVQPLPDVIEVRPLADIKPGYGTSADSQAKGLEGAKPLVTAAGKADPQVIARPASKSVKPTFGEPIAPKSAAIGSAKERYHSVEAGETLFAISRQYRLPVEHLIESNDLRPPYHLRSGQSLRIPAGRRVIVDSGDTLYGISRRYGISVTQLVEQNGLARPYRIKKGQILRLPPAHQPSIPQAAVQLANASTDEVPSAALSATTGAKQARPVALAQPAARSGGKFEWPTYGRVVAGFGPRAGGLHNDGINILAERGQAVVAAENGVVAYAGNELRGFGNLLLVKHADGWVTAYAHLENFEVSRGDRVARGQTIGRVGSSGHVVRPQLHFEIRKGTKAIDPQKYLTIQQAGLE